MNFKQLLNQRSSKSILDSEIVRLKRSISKISDSNSPFYKSQISLYHALLRKKIRDSIKRISDADVADIKQLMLDDLKSNLDEGRIYFTPGTYSDVAILYTTKDNLLKSIKKHGSDLGNGFQNASTEEELNNLLDSFGYDNLKGRYIKIESRNDGSIEIYDGDAVEFLYPSINYFAQLFLEGDPNAGKVRFVEDNDELGEQVFETI